MMVERHPPPHFQAPAPATSPLKSLLMTIRRSVKGLLN